MGLLTGTHYEDDGAAEVAQRPTMVEVPSGLYVDIANPSADTILLHDIAHKLGQINRWGGSSHWPISVALHAVYVSERAAQLGADARQQLLALHHDDHEAYLLDIPRPWKALLGPIYRRLVAKFDVRIAEALLLPPAGGADHDIIKLADNFLMLLEAKHLMPSEGRHWKTLKRGEDGMPLKIVTPDWWIDEEVHWADARDLYLERHYELVKQLEAP